MAAHNSGGLVIAQVERLAEVNTLNPRQVKIPGALVDCIVVATAPGNHPQTLASPYSPAFAAEVRVPLTSFAPMPMSARMTVIEDVVAKIRETCGPLGRKVYAVVDYEGFELDSDLEDAYLDAVQEIDDAYFHGVTRFTTSAFMRVKLGSALESRGVAPHIYESEGEAAGAVRASLPCQE